MGWIFSVVMVLVFAFAAYRRAKQAGLWSWSKFAFTLGFLLFEILVVTTPLMFLSMNSRYFWPAYSAAWVLGAVFFALFIIRARKWKLPNGKTSLEAEREITHGK
jgi:hypothetical protein